MIFGLTESHNQRDPSCPGITEAELPMLSERSVSKLYGLPRSVATPLGGALFQYRLMELVPVVEVVQVHRVFEGGTIIGKTAIF